MTTAVQDGIAFTSPMECLPVSNLPESSDWVYELKLDGYRGQAIHDKRGMRIFSRRGKNLSRKYPGVVAALKNALPLGTSVDGELVAFDETGQLSFNALQNADGNTHVAFFVFDLLVHRGKDTKHLPLTERISLLRKRSPRQN